MDAHKAIRTTRLWTRRSASGRANRDHVRPCPIRSGPFPPVTNRTTFLLTRCQGPEPGAASTQGDDHSEHRRHLSRSEPGACDQSGPPRCAAARQCDGPLARRIDAADQHGRSPDGQHPGRQSRRGTGRCPASGRSAFRRDGPEHGPRIRVLHGGSGRYGGHARRRLPRRADPLHAADRPGDHRERAG